MGQDATPAASILLIAILAAALYLGRLSQDALVLIGEGHPLETTAHVVAWACALLLATLAVLRVLFWLLVDRVDAQIARECRERQRRFEPMDRL